MSKAREFFFKKGPIGGGVQTYPYQFSFGLSLRYWPCLFAPSIRLHFGPFKFWLYWQWKKSMTTETPLSNEAKP